MPPRPLPPGTPAAAIVEEEERLLALVEAQIAGQGLDGGPTHDYEHELVSLRDQIAEAKPEDVAPLVEQMIRAQSLAAQRGRSRALPVDVMSPYFAHIRLENRRQPGGRPRDILIGKRGFIDRESGVQIVDWRNAPISRIYYRYEEGDDYDETFEGGKLEGVVLARRNVSISGARLRRIGCPQGTFVRDARGVWFAAEGALTPVLQGGQGTASRPPTPAAAEAERRARRLGIHAGPVPRADKHLPEIAALIDRDQFDLITQPESGLVVIQGGAGSGKTTVALHRVAYLAFADGDRFRPGKILVVVPSVALARYIEGVLPSLGVPGVPVVVTHAWAASMRQRLVPEAGKRYADDAPEAVTRIKKHPAVLRLLEEYVADQGRAFEDELPAEVRPRWRELAAEPLVTRCRRTLSWLDKQGSDLPAMVRHQADAILRRLRKRAGDVVRDWEEILGDDSRLAAAFARHAPGEATPEELALVARRIAAQKEVLEESDHAGIDADRLVAVDGAPLEDEAETLAGRLDPEDDPLLLRLVQLKRGGLVPRRTKEQKEVRETRYEHVVIDEAQDLSAVEIKVLLEATTPGRSVTIAGDTAQRLVFDNAFRDWTSLLADAGHPVAVVRPLHLSYRSTAEVMRFARAVLGPLADPDQPLIARNGAPVLFQGFAELGEAVAFLAEALRSLMAREPTASVALVTRHPEQADAYHSALAGAEVPALRRVRRGEFPFVAGIDVTDVTQVKGLEFDYVILLEVSAVSYPDAVEARHLLHIAATRAAHQLWVTTTGERSPLLPAELVDEGALG